MSAVPPLRPSIGGAIADSGKIYARAVTGLFARLRWIMVWVTQGVFYGLPWLPWGDRQAVLFDVEGRRFHVFGLVLQPQDLIFLAGLMVVAALALFFFTALAGRLWCGYACPQTVYTEIFMWIEKVTEGDRTARISLDRAPWGWNKLRRKGAKHALWLLVAMITGFTFVGYFTPIRELGVEVATLSATPWETFWIAFYGFATYGNAGWLREQICKFMCPYARIQSTLIDADSLIIAYDVRRGDPRGARSRKADPAALGLGDCVDCTMCVQVCPTGIDIRNGLQNECIGCAACIDACDSVMTRMGYATGLIRYATERGLAEGWTGRQMLRRALRPRVLVYGALLLAAGVALAIGLASRSPMLVDVIRDRGALGRVADDGSIENVYRLQLTNRTEGPLHYAVTVEGLPGLAIAVGGDGELQAGDVLPRMLRLTLPEPAAATLGPGAHRIDIRIRAQTGADEAEIREKTTFFVPR